MRPPNSYALFAVSLIFSLVTWMPVSWAVDVTSDDAADQFVGAGQAQHNSPGRESQPGTGHGCSQCQWMLGDPCSSQYNSIACGTVTEGCSLGQEQRRQWFSVDDGLTWQDRGLVCIGAGSAAIDPGGEQLHAAFARSVPPVHITVEPNTGVLPQVPAIFDSGQPQSLAPSTHLVGSVSVRLMPTASWFWTFGDGSALETHISGSHYPHFEVSHTYGRAGNYRVQLTTVWQATYSIDGQGPFAVDGEITQESTIDVLVGQGRAVLAPNR